MGNIFSARINSNQEIAAGTYVLRFDRQFDFIAGQVIGLSLKADQEPRLYSIASGMDDPEINILYSIQPHGKLTPDLSKLTPGEKIWHSMPFGKFTGNEKPAVWIATGTGIAPFASMAFSGLGFNKTLIYGNRYSNKLYFHEQLRHIIQGRYFPCSSREQQPGMFFGRVTDFVERLQNLDTSVPYYLCGSAEMVVDMRDLLIKKGVPFSNIISEIFF
jgi:ferredoxin/flavodoxin---NADP+ reductase